MYRRLRRRSKKRSHVRMSSEVVLAVVVDACRRVLNDSAATFCCIIMVFRLGREASRVVRLDASRVVMVEHAAGLALAKALILLLALIDRRHVDLEQTSVAMLKS